MTTQAMNTNTVRIYSKSTACVDNMSIHNTIYSLLSMLPAANSMDWTMGASRTDSCFPKSPHFESIDACPIVSPSGCPSKTYTLGKYWLYGKISSIASWYPISPNIMNLAGCDYRAASWTLKKDWKSGQWGLRCKPAAQGSDTSSVHWRSPSNCCRWLHSLCPSRLGMSLTWARGGEKLFGPFGTSLRVVATQGGP